MPYDHLIARSPDGIPYARPEVNLLFKVKSARPKDESNFATVLPRLDAKARRRATGALDLVHPGHQWLAMLR